MLDMSMEQLISSTYLVKNWVKIGGLGCPNQMGRLGSSPKEKPGRLVTVISTQNPSPPEPELHKRA